MTTYHHRHNFCEMERNEELSNLNRHFTIIESSEARRQTIAKTSILIVLTLERLAYYALVTSFFLFLNEGPWDKGQSWDSLEALNAVFFLTGISYLSALLGGYLSDAWLGRFRAIAAGFLLYIVGYILLTLISVGKLPRYACSGSGLNDPDPGVNFEAKPPAPCKGMIYLSLTILGIGTGTVKSNIAPFGAEQLRGANSQKLRSFFNWFYWCVNIGSLIGIGAIAFIEQDDPGICTNGFFCGYFIGSICLGLGLVLFLCAYPWYYIAHSEGSLLRDIVKIVIEAMKANVRHWRYNRQNPNLSPLHVEPAFLDRAKIRYGGSFHEGAVDDVSALGKLLAVFSALIPYWIVAFQMETSFQAQGLHMRFGDFTNNISHNMNLPVDEDASQWRFSIPAAWLTLFNQAFIILAIPILTSFLYPRLDRSGIRVSLFFRIGLGMVFSMLAVMSAGGLESYRLYLWKNDPSSHIDLVIGNVTYHAVDISIFWQVPQYVLVGAAEVFANIAGLEFAYTAAPPTFQGLIMGLFYSLEGCASFLGILLLRLITPFWFNNSSDRSSINDNHLDFYLYFLGIIQFVTLAAFSTVLYVRRFALKLVGMSPPHDGAAREHGDGRSDTLGLERSSEEDGELDRSENERRSTSSMNEDDDRKPLII